MLRSPLRTVSIAIAAVLACAAVQAAEGEIRKVDAAQGKVTIAHEAIQELGMPAMTMTYRAKPARLLEGVAVGDKVQFRADKVDGQYVVTALQKH